MGSAMHEPVLYFVDDDEQLLSALSDYFFDDGLTCETFASAEAFLDALPTGKVGCLLLDLRMDGMSGLELQRKLANAEFALPIIYLTGHGEIRSAVEAVKRGAFDFLEKPFENEDLKKVINAAIDLSRSKFEKTRRLEKLTKRELQVAQLLAKGKANKQVAQELGISGSTAEFHRANLMQKLAISSIDKLVDLITPE
jgi:FixJ family two-component response regulator